MGRRSGARKPAEGAKAIGARDQQLANDSASENQFTDNNNSQDTVNQVLSKDEIQSAFNDMEKEYFIHNTAPAQAMDNEINYAIKLSHELVDKFKDLSCEHDSHNMDAEVLLSRCNEAQEAREHALAEAHSANQAFDYAIVEAKVIGRDFEKAWSRARTTDDPIKNIINKAKSLDKSFSRTVSRTPPPPEHMIVNSAHAPHDLPVNIRRYLQDMEVIHTESIELVPVMEELWMAINTLLYSYIITVHPESWENFKKTEMHKDESIEIYEMNRRSCLAINEVYHCTLRKLIEFFIGPAGSKWVGTPLSTSFKRAADGERRRIGDQYFSLADLTLIKSEKYLPIEVIVERKEKGFEKAKAKLRELEGSKTGAEYVHHKDSYGQSWRFVMLKKGGKREWKIV